MFRLIRSIFSMISGWFGAKADSMQENVHVMSATFDAAINAKSTNFETVKNAVATLVGMKSNKTKEIKNLTEKIEKLSRIKVAAGAKLKQRAQAIVVKCQSEGITDKAQVQSELSKDPEYLKHQGAFNDASSSLSEATEEVARKESELEGFEKKIATHKAQLQQMQRNIRNLSEEKHDAIAQTQLAKEMEAVDAALAGVATTQEDKDLQAARAARDRAVARQEITSELAGNDAQLAEDEYLAYSNAIEANNELDDLIDLDSMLGSGTEAGLNEAKLPE